MSIIFGDQTCRRCGDNYFSKNATKDMEKHNLCWHCIAGHKRKFNDMSLKEFSKTKRECSHYKL